MTSIYETEKKDLKNPSVIYNSSNKKSINTNRFDNPQKTYAYQQSNLNSTDNMNNSKTNNFFSGVFSYPINWQSPSKESNLDCEIFNSNLNSNIPPANILAYNFQQLNSGIAPIISDNLILKEDIYKYNNMNRYLENEIKIQKDHNNDLIRTNKKLLEENNGLNDQLINDNNVLNDLMQERNEKNKECEENQKRLEMNNDKVDKDYDELLNINNKTKNDYNILSQNYDELNTKNNNVKNEICLLKEMENKHLSDIEDKIKNIIKEIEELKKEQNDLNRENNENKNKLDKIKKEKDELYNQYQQEIILSDKLNNNLCNNKINLNKIKNKCQKLKENRNKKVKNRPSSINKKKALIKDLQKKIANYKIKTLRNTSINDDY